MDTNDNKTEKMNTNDLINRITKMYDYLNSKKMIGGEIEMSPYEYRDAMISAFKIHLGKFKISHVLDDNLIIGLRKILTSRNNEDKKINFISFIIKLLEFSDLIKNTIPNSDMLLYICVGISRYSYKMMEKDLEAYIHYNHVDYRIKYHLDEHSKEPYAKFYEECCALDPNTLNIVNGLPMPGYKSAIGELDIEKVKSVGVELKIKNFEFYSDYVFSSLAVLIHNRKFKDVVIFLKDMEFLYDNNNTNKDYCVLMGMLSQITTVVFNERNYPLPWFI